MPDSTPPDSGIIFYQADDGRTRIECRFDNGSLWLTQVQFSELFQSSVPNVNMHLRAIYARGEQTEAATIQSYLIVRYEGARQVSRDVLHYSVPVILGVGYRVRCASRPRRKRIACLKAPSGKRCAESRRSHE